MLSDHTVPVGRGFDVDSPVPVGNVGRRDLALLAAGMAQPEIVV